MGKNKVLLDEIILFVREFIREYKLEITEDTLIEDDLGVTGEEAEELIVAFSKKYEVNINEFKFNEYFYPEPFGFGVDDVKRKPFKIGYLEAAVKFGRLDERAINSFV